MVLDFAERTEDPYVVFEYIPRYIRLIDGRVLVRFQVDQRFFRDAFMSRDSYTITAISMVSTLVRRSRLETLKDMAYFDRGNSFFLACTLQRQSGENSGRFERLDSHKR